MAERKYKSDTLHNQWQSFRVKKNPTDDYEATHKYEESREYQIMVKVVDGVGNDMNKLILLLTGAHSIFMA